MQFDDRAQCLVSQYGALDGAPGIKINGQLTLGENIADLGGVKLALAALKPTGAANGTFTDTQLFFIAYAQAWCQKVQPALAEQLLSIDPHSPSAAASTPCSPTRLSSPTPSRARVGRRSRRPIAAACGDATSDGLDLRLRPDVLGGAQVHQRVHQPRGVSGFFSGSSPAFTASRPCPSPA